MAATPGRIRTQRHVTAMVALDTVGLLAERVTNLLSHDRRIAMTRRSTWADSPPEVLVGLTVDGQPRLWTGSGGRGIEVRLKPGSLAGFGFAAYPGEADTEAAVWLRYHAAKGADDDVSTRRRDMIHVVINGGMRHDGPARDDRIVIRSWNRDGACTEQVIAFDTGLLWEQQDAAQAGA